ncbi:phage minor capsid protein [Lentisphaerota bacterium WC36G]|nr:hypothetical protein LJT99_05300 [Lentisphaerae bacterium WC36]
MPKSPIRKKLQSHATKGYSELQAKADDLYKIYVSARKSIEDAIEDYVLAARTSYSGPRLVKLMNEIQKICNNLEKTYRENHEYHTKYVIQSFFRNALADVYYGKKPLNKVLLDVDKNLIDNMLKDDFAHIAGATQKMSTQTVGALRRISSDILNKATLTGATPAEIGKELFFRNGGNAFQFIAKNGAKWNSDAYFKMLGRTTLFNNARESYLHGCAKSGNDVVTISVSAKPCDKCAKYEDRLLSISGKHPKYMSLDSAISDGLFHPNCTHRIIAVDEVDQEMDYDEKGNPSNSFIKNIKLPSKKKINTKTKKINIQGNQKTKPRGVPVSNALEFKSTNKIASQVKNALDAIDSVHGDGVLNKIPIRQSRGTKTLGHYKYSLLDNMPKEIAVSSQGSHQGLTLVHEVGHYLHLFAIKEHNNILDDLLVAIKESATYQKIQKNAHLFNRSGYNYVTDKSELFARTYAQFIATKSKNKLLLDQLNEIVEKQANSIYSSQWTNEDFIKIYDEFEKLLKALNWRY